MAWMRGWLGRWIGGWFGPVSYTPPPEVGELTLGEPGLAYVGRLSAAVAYVGRLSVDADVTYLGRWTATLEIER
jgi:hypothetical protein